ncbi:MAG: hypothetical protein U9R14_04730 [Patescibacteria group bacterium]|nr:hypothetical protein [Patescibacteria group bacterium]
MKNIKTTIFSNGVILQAVECIINGKKQWRWIVNSFEYDSFLNGKLINPVEYGTKQDNLTEKFENGYN